MFVKIFSIFLLVAVLIPIPVFADDGSKSVAKDLGWIAIGCGITANLPFIVLNKYRRYAISVGGQSLQVAKKIGTSFKPILNFHIMMNSIGYFAGMAHGLALSRHLDSISLSLVITMTLLMGSGIMLKYSSSRHTRLFHRLLHGQFGLVVLLIALVMLHVLSADD